MQFLFGDEDATTWRRESDVKYDSERATRFAVRLPMRYRPAGMSDWWEGQVENISRSGVLFRAEHPLAVETALEMRFELPLADIAPGLVCRGRVVRTILPSPGGAPPGLAATISTYQFVRGAAARD